MDHVRCKEVQSKYKNRLLLQRKRGEGDRRRVREIEREKDREKGRER